MNIDTPLFVFCLFDSGALLFLSVYILVTLSDLECDHLNAKQCCEKLNKWVIPEIIAVKILSLLFLVTGHWFLFLINFLVFLWLGSRYFKIPKANFGIYDPIEIHNYGRLKNHFKHSLICLILYLLLFCIYLYLMIISLLTLS